MYGFSSRLSLKYDKGGTVFLYDEGYARERKNCKSPRALLFRSACLRYLCFTKIGCVSLFHEDRMRIFVSRR